MSEFHDPGIDPTAKLAETVVKLGIGIVQERDFMGRKVALEAMDQFGYSGELEDEDAAWLADMMGVCVTSGIVLSARGETDEASIQSEVERLSEPLHPRLAHLMQIPRLIVRGIEFYREPFAESPKVQEWRRELALLRSTEQL